MKFNEAVIYDNTGKPILKSFHSSVKPEKRFYREHHHTECELSIFVSGDGIYNVNQRVYDFHAGNVFLFGSNEIHCITEINSSLHLLNIQFEPRLLWEYPENAEMLRLFNSRKSNFSNRFEDDETLKKYIFSIEKELSEKRTGYVIEAKYLLYSALIHIIREYNSTHSMTDTLNSSEGMRSAIAYINQNLEKKLILKDIADYACMSETYFSSVFKKFNGISPWDYITIKRVERAIELLKTTSQNKLQIAEKCGFSSPSNFYKAFKQVTGKAPGDFTAR